MVRFFLHFTHKSLIVCRILTDTFLDRAEFRMLGIWDHFRTLVNLNFTAVADGSENPMAMCASDLILNFYPGYEYPNKFTMALLNLAVLDTGYSYQSYGYYTYTCRILAMHTKFSTGYSYQDPSY
eukprot:SAG11_NODE_2305_length_3547_cov_2.199536_1_plen_125_part_00